VDLRSTPTDDQTLTTEGTMTETPSADELARENAELRERNGKLEDEQRTTIRRQAAVEAGLEPDAARWIKGDTVEDAVADARTLARQLGSRPTGPTSATSPEADAIQRHTREQRDAVASLFGDDNHDDH
jgi:hypothetical protein